MRYVITVDVLRDKIVVAVSRDGKPYDRASFALHEDYAELFEFGLYMSGLADEIEREVRRRLWA